MDYFFGLSSKEKCRYAVDYFNSRKRNYQVKYTTEQIEAIALKLRTMPAIEKKKLHSKQEAVKLLAKEIAAMQKRGYALEQISEALKGQGLPVTTPTLKSYLQRAKPEPARKTASASPTPAPVPVPAPETEPASIPGKKGAKGTFTAKPDTRDI